MSLPATREAIRQTLKQGTAADCVPQTTLVIAYVLQVKESRQAQNGRFKDNLQARKGSTYCLHWMVRIKNYPRSGICMVGRPSAQFHNIALNKSAQNKADSLK